MKGSKSKIGSANMPNYGNEEEDRHIPNILRSPTPRYRTKSEVFTMRALLLVGLVLLLRLGLYLMGFRGIYPYEP